MTIRTFKQIGQGYGSAPCTITANINGSQVYSGTVPTVDEPLPILPNPSLAVTSELFGWSVNDVSYTGTQTMEITVSGSPLLVTEIVANYSPVQNPQLPISPIPGGAGVFSSLPSDVIPGDYLINVEIDGIPQTSMEGEGETGQSYWVVPVGSVFTATVNVINPGLDAPIWDPAVTYGYRSFVTYNDQMYFCDRPQGVPVGTAPSDLSYWTTIPFPEWNSSSTYLQFQRVRSGNDGYRALNAVPANTPVSDTNYWAPINSNY